MKLHLHQSLPPTHLQLGHGGPSVPVGHPQIMQNDPEACVGCLARNEHGSFIIMEFLDFGGGRSDAHELGAGLAKMHLAKPTVSHFKAPRRA